VATRRRFYGDFVGDVKESLRILKEVQRLMKNRQSKK
jgi:hypothetical protein